MSPEGGREGGREEEGPISFTDMVMVVDWTTIYFLQRRSNTISRSWARGDGALLFGLAVTGGRRMSELEPHLFRWRYFVMSFLLLEKFWFNQLKELIEPLSPKKL